MVRTIEETVCDFCGEVSNHYEKIKISINYYDICPACMERLIAVMNWKETKEKYVGFNFNHEVEATLAQDGVDAYNIPYGIPELERKGNDKAKPGFKLQTSLHNFCQLMIPAFKKMVGCYQEVCYPFELRFKVGGLQLREPHDE